MAKLIRIHFRIGNLNSKLDYLKTTEKIILSHNWKLKSNQMLQPIRVMPNLWTVRNISDGSGYYSKLGFGVFWKCWFRVPVPSLFTYYIYIILNIYICLLRLLICPLKISTIFILLGIGVRQDPYYSYYIGLRNKKEESLKLYEVEQV